LIARYGDIKSNTFFIQLINLQQRGPITKHIQKFQKLSLKVKKIPEDNLLDIFIGTLKERIQHEVCLFKDKSLEHVFSAVRKVESKNFATRRVAINNYRE
jgi:hypothetical protein